MYLVTISERGLIPEETTTGQGDFAQTSVVFDQYSSARKFAEDHADHANVQAQIWALKSTCEPVRKVVWSDYTGNGNSVNDVRMAS